MKLTGHAKSWIWEAFLIFHFVAWPKQVVWELQELFQVLKNKKQKKTPPPTLTQRDWILKADKLHVNVSTKSYFFLCFCSQLASS